MPKFSVIIPVYNAGDFLWRSWSSLMAQSFRDFEVIFVNDGSSDDSLPQLHNIAASNAYVKIIDLSANAGQGNARNVGMAAATGEWLLFCDADDAYFPDALQQIAPGTEQPNIEVLYFNGYLEPHTTGTGVANYRRQITHNLLIQSFLSTDKERVQALKDIDLTSFSPCSIALRRSSREREGLTFEERIISEDWLFNWTVLSRNLPFAFLNRPLYQYYIHSNTESLTTTMLRYQKDSRLFDYFKVFESGREALSRLPEWYAIETTTYRRAESSLLGQLAPFRRFAYRSQEGLLGWQRYLGELHKVFTGMPLALQSDTLSRWERGNEALALFLRSPLTGQSLLDYIAFERRWGRRGRQLVQEWAIHVLREAGTKRESQALAAALQTALQIPHLCVRIALKLVHNFFRKRD